MRSRRYGARRLRYRSIGPSQVGRFHRHHPPPRVCRGNRHWAGPRSYGIAIVCRITTETQNSALRTATPEPHPRYEVPHLERLRLGMPYPAQVDAIEAMLSRAPLNGLSPCVLVDYTGVGRPVFDMFAGRYALRRAQGVVITGGRETTRHGPGWSVPKGELVSKLQALFMPGSCASRPACQTPPF